MGHVTHEASWCTIDVDTEAGKVVVLQRWQYEWLLESDRMTRWTLAEKQAFHARAEREIWNAWSNRAHLKVEGSSDFARRFHGRDIPVFMDIRWVLGKPHFTVRVTKVAEKVFIQSRVPWDKHTIHLDTNDFVTRTKCFGPNKTQCVSQVPVAHEFGHSLGPVSGGHGEPGRVPNEERALRGYQQHHASGQSAARATLRAAHDRAVRADPRDVLQRGARAMTRRPWIACLISLCCCKADDGAKSPPPSPAITAIETPKAAAASPEPEKLPATSCEEGLDFKLAGTPRERVETRFGPPTERESYRADDVGGEFYVAVEQTYPSSDPKNADVPIEEWTWHSGDCRLTVWFHKPNGTWEVLDDVFYDHRTQF